MRWLTGSAKRGPRSAARCRSSAGSLSLAALGRTAKPNVSTGPCKPSGLTPKRGPATLKEQQRLHPGWPTTTLNEPTPHSAAKPRSAASPREQRVRSEQLDAAGLKRAIRFYEQGWSTERVGVEL